MKELISYRIPPRDETVVTLYDENFIEITQTSPLGEDAEPVRIDYEDIATLQDLLDKLRRYKKEEAAV
jgi:hypothetical protein